MVDDFGVKYFGKEHALHLKQAIEENYGVTTDWAGAQYIVMTIEWDYSNKCVHILIAGYVAKALKKIQHTKPKK